MAASVWAPGSDVILANAEQSALIEKFVATAGQTVFDLTSFSYVPDTDSLRVYRNGVKLEQAQVSETSETQFTLTGVTLLTGEIIEATGILGSQDAVVAAALAAAKSAAEAAESAASIDVSNLVTKLNPVMSGILTHSGDVVIEGTGKRITGDFSNAAVVNRVMFQTNVIDGITRISAIPGGSAANCGIELYSSADPANASVAQLVMNGTETRIQSNQTGSGSYLPIALYTGGVEQVVVPVAGGLLVTQPAGLGYGTGAGGTVTQATSKSTAVTLNKPCGQITMHNAALAAGAKVTFAVSNSVCAASNVPAVSLGAIGTGLTYRCSVPYVYGGGFYVTLENISAGSLSEAVVINFAIIKGATS